MPFICVGSPPGNRREGFVVQRQQARAQRLGTPARNRRLALVLRSIVCAGPDAERRDPVATHLVHRFDFAFPSYILAQPSIAVAFFWLRLGEMTFDNRIRQVRKTSNGSLSADRQAQGSDTQPFNIRSANVQGKHTSKKKTKRKDAPAARRVTRSFVPSNRCASIGCPSKPVPFVARKSEVGSAKQGHPREKESRTSFKFFHLEFDPSSG